MKDLTIAESYYYFGDTKDDIISARGASYIPVGILPPQDKSQNLKNDLNSEGANFVLNSINDINLILEQKDERVC